MDLKLSFFVSSNMLPVNVLYFETVSTAMLQLMYKPIVYRRVFVNYSSNVHLYNTPILCAARLNINLHVFTSFGKIME